MQINELLQRASALRARQRKASLIESKTPPAWYAIKAAADEEVIVDIFGEIGWDVDAGLFAQELRDVTADPITVEMNSVGGDVFQGIAIFNALQNHPSAVNVKVLGIAASIASVIAMAGDNIAIAKNAQMMIHDAIGMTFGNAEDHREMALLLDSSSEIIAQTYADRAGGTRDEWRTAMKATSWYTGDQAVEAGLADELMPLSSKKKVAAQAEVRQRMQRIAAHATQDPPEPVPSVEGVPLPADFAASFRETASYSPPPTLEELLAKQKADEGLAIGPGRGGS